MGPNLRCLVFYKRRTFGQTHTEGRHVKTQGRRAIYKMRRDASKETYPGSSLVSYIQDCEKIHFWLSAPSVVLAMVARAESYNAAAVAAGMPPGQLLWLLGQGLVVGPGWAQSGVMRRWPQEMPRGLKLGRAWNQMCPLSLKVFGCAEEGGTWCWFRPIWKAALQAVLLNVSIPHGTDLAPLSLKQTSSNPKFFLLSIRQSDIFQSLVGWRTALIKKDQIIFFLSEHDHTQG